LADDKNKEIKKLMKAFQKGDRTALERLMLLVHKDLLYIAYGYLKDTHLAEDVVSETFVTLIEKIHTIKNDSNLGGYLRTITINKSLNLIRKRKKEFFTDGGELVSHEIGIYVGNKQDDMVRYCLVQLQPPILREAFLLWSYGFTINEISGKTGLSVSQVRTVLEKAKQSFLRKYRKFEEV